MKPALRVSQIAWPPELEEEGFALLSELGIPGIELAPPRVWKNPAAPLPAETEAIQSLLTKHSLHCGGFQALLFGRPELTVFGSEESRADCITFLQGVMNRAEELGARILVFGSPKNRSRGELPLSEAVSRSIPFFRELGNYASERNLYFCIEPNPPVYGCDFIQTAREGAELVRKVDSPGFRLHLDCGALLLNGEEPASAIADCADVLVSFHASEPELGSFESPRAPHAAAAQALREVKYTGEISLEMRAQSQPLEALRTAILRVKELYTA